MPPPRSGPTAQGHFPPWRTVHSIFTRWFQDGDVDAVHNDLRDLVRQAEGRETDPTAAIIDSQSVRAAETVGADSRAYDAGKKVAGRKRHVITDCLGLLLVVIVTTASVQDHDGAKPALTHLRELFETIPLVWADGGYADKLVTRARTKLRLTLEIVGHSEPFPVTDHGGLLGNVTVAVRDDAGWWDGDSMPDMSGASGRNGSAKITFRTTRGSTWRPVSPTPPCSMSAGRPPSTLRGCCAGTANSSGPAGAPARWASSGRRCSCCAGSSTAPGRPNLRGTTASRCRPPTATCTRD
ncbi:transposase [Streptomyces sp. KMM 9044]|uniref:transposase n=1 Tax=Streptomyces sp. KMM 9044 TaxID=2744474 RepID=UPI003FA69208